MAQHAQRMRVVGFRRLRVVGAPARLRRLLRRGTDSLVLQLGAFGVVGALCFVLDLAVFNLLYTHVDAGAVTSKLLAGIVSTTAAFAGHRFWSFSRRARTGLRREYLRFAAINGATLLVGLAIVAFVRYPLGQEDALVLQAANVVSIVVGTVLRYLAYSKWVFPASITPVVEPVVLGAPDRDPGPQPAASRG